LALTGAAKAAVLAVGLDTPGPTSAEGVISSRGSTNFSHPAWRSFDIRSGLEDRLQLPVIRNNDGNAAALYAHQMHFGSAGSEHSSIAAIVGTGLGGGVIEAGLVVKGASGMAGELGHGWPASQLSRTLTCLGSGRRSGGSDHASETVRRPCSPIAAAHPIRWSAVGKPATFGGSEPSLNECRR
jgi:predicted NBD/HSP70 family sugar kinase